MKPYPRWSDIHWLTLDHEGEEGDEEPVYGFLSAHDDPVHGGHGCWICICWENAGKDNFEPLPTEFGEYQIGIEDEEGGLCWRAEAQP